MVTCPRCGNDADYLADDAFALIRCVFCGDDIDATDLVPRQDAQAA
jgi:ribosomal protein S27E